LSTIQCAAEAFCCPSPPAIEQCQRARAETCNQNGFFDAIFGSPVIGYDIDRAEAAFSEFEKRASACDPGIVRWAISDAGFRGVARGTIPPGADCMPTGPTSSDPVRNFAQLGSCAEPEKMTCLGLAPSKWVCSPRSALGGPCISDLNCMDGLGCNFMSPMGSCVERSANGIPCGTLLECQSLHCDVTGVCADPTIVDLFCLPY